MNTTIQFTKAEAAHRPPRRTSDAIAITISSKAIFKRGALSGRIGLHFDVTVPHYSILTLSCEDRILQSTNIITGKSTVLQEWQNDISLDMYIDNVYWSARRNDFKISFVYFLNRANGSIERFTHLVGDLEIQDTWMIDPHKLTPLSRIAIASNPNEGTSVAYIAPCKNQAVMSIALDEQGASQELILNFTDPKLPLGEEVYLCIDNQKGTLLLSDTQNHRVIEVDRQSGNAEVICGSGVPGNADEGEPARLAKLASPRAIAIYRPSEMIDEAQITTQSQEVIKPKYGKATPRSIILADSGNRSIKRIVDASLLTTRSAFTPAESLIFTLLGSGEPTKDLGEPSGDSLYDLSSHPIPEPYELAVSLLGDLLIGCRSTPSLMLLRPATSIARQKEHYKGLDGQLYLS